MQGMVDKFSGCPRGFDYEKQAMDEAIEEMNGLIIEEKVQPQGSGRD